MKRTKEPDIRAIRQEKAESALAAVKRHIPGAFIGELNDSSYYLVVPKGQEREAEGVLAGIGTESEMEYREMTGDVALYLKDEEPDDGQEELA